MTVKNKKAVFFIGLPHHAQKLIPVAEYLKKEGMRTIFLTAANLPSLGEGNRQCFELYLMQHNIPYQHIYKYRTPALKKHLEKNNQKLILEAKQLLKTDDFQTFTHFDPELLMDSLTEALECRLLFEKMMEIEKPDILLGLHEANFWVKLMAQVGHEKKIPVLTFQEGFYTISEARVEKYTIMADYSSVALWGEEAKETILNHTPHAGENLFLTGNPEYDSFFKLSEEEIHQQELAIRQKMSIPGKTKICLMLMPNPYERYRDAIPLKNIADFFNTLNHTQLLIKWHPRESRKTIQEFKNLESKGSIKQMDSGDIKQILPACNLCMVLDSSAGLDAIIYQKPLIEINMSNHKYGRSYAEDNVALIIRSFDQLPLIKKVLSGKLKTYYKKDRDRYLKRIFYKTDGKSSQRIIELIQKLIK